MPNVNVLTNAVMIPELWADMILEYRRDRLVMADHVMRLDSMVKSKGDLIHIPRASKSIARDKVANTTVAYEANTEGEFTLPITAHRYSAKIIEDIAKVQSQYDLMSLYTRDMSYVLAERVDNDLHGLYTATAQTVGVVATSTTSRMAKTHWLAARRMLDLAKAPISGRYASIDAYGMEQLYQIDDFIHYDATGQAAAVATGKLPKGRLYGIEVLETFAQNPIVSSIAYGLIWQKDGIALAMQRDVQIESEKSADWIGTKVVAHEIYGYGAPRTDHIVAFQYGVA